MIIWNIVHFISIILLLKDIQLNIKILKYDPLKSVKWNIICPMYNNNKFKSWFFL